MDNVRHGSPPQVRHVERAPAGEQPECGRHVAFPKDAALAANHLVVVLYRVDALDPTQERPGRIFERVYKPA